MGHDVHFLQRIERLEREHAEIALGLYHDASLVRLLVKQVDLPEGSDRVAISLDHPEEGPFLIVARDGHFVTCLGRGMKLSGDRAVITRHKLDVLSERTDRLRKMLAAAKSNRYQETTRLLRRIDQAGDRLTREEFEDLARWIPLLGKHFFSGFVESLARTYDTWERIERIKRLDASRHQKVLYGYWRSTWALSHYALLLGTDNGETLTRAFEYVEREEDAPRSRTYVFPRPFVQTGLTSFAARGLWITSKIPKLLLSDLKRDYGEAFTINSTLANGLGLAAIGLRHRQLQAEVGKALARSLTVPPDLADLPEVVKGLEAGRELIRATYGAAKETRDELREATVAIARDIVAQVAEDEGPEIASMLSGLPDDVAIAYVLTLSIPLRTEEGGGLFYLLEWLPWLVRADPGAFYIPAQYAALNRGPWHRDEAVAMIAFRREQEGPPPDEGPKEPARNAPCPCGSGKKYKRCCGNTG
jgi:hypothetical protein